MKWQRAGRLALVLVFGGFLLGPAAVVRAGQAEVLLPDLAMVAPSEFRIEFSDGRRLLRFTTIAVNIGRGPFRLFGFDEDGLAEIGDTLAVRQELRWSDGTFTRRSTTATMTWSGDGHNHWHIDGYQKFWLQKLDGTRLDYVAKTGFCAFDSYRYGSTKAPWFTWERYICRTAPSGEVPMGTSRRWGDVYRSTIAFQWVDITGLPAGTYKVVVAVDPRTDLGGKFRESNEANNRAWARIRISQSGVSVLARSANP